jgi:hypothetical protein
VEGERTPTVDFVPGRVEELQRTTEQPRSNVEVELLRRVLLKRTGRRRLLEAYFEQDLPVEVVSLVEGRYRRRKRAYSHPPSLRSTTEPPTMLVEVV